MKELTVLENYEITTCGRVFNKKTGKELSVSLDKDRYKRASLVYGKVSVRNKNGKMAKPRQPFQLHRLINIKYNGLPPKGMNVVNHKNLNKQDLRYTNLEWSNVSKNTQHGYDNGAYHSVRRILVYNVKTGKQYEFITTSMASRELGVPNPTLQTLGNKQNSYSKKHNIMVSKIAVDN